ncbi:hypothetical protein ASD65_07245 [Microbacterium sp. Root61]|uniref:DUF305 domain-containing protein n=1 Tax=Microbacterium sp. Root61 TaxID=1736570 RepID=UPI0006F54C6D|nr:DUF305 domain-containing protein [Microbacterium sp. Root61]KRA24239.1 hypothetical protein ASD65_07245 [Microbacterium sp. Root61]
MRSRIAGVGMIVAVTIALVGLSTVALAITTPRTTPVAAPASAPILNAQGQRFPVAADYCYVEAMIPHHTQALELSGIVLAADGIGDRTRALAEFIVTDQTAEIRTMDAWRTAWVASSGESAAPASAHGAHGASSANEPVDAPIAGCGDHASHEGMKGMATPEQISEFETLDGFAAQTRFLELMIAHHIGALEMAELAVREGTNAYVRSSAKHVLIEQDREITAMTALLAGE